MSGHLPEKYSSDLEFRKVQARRWVIRRFIRNLTAWKPLENPREGYTVVIGCNVPLARMLACNLRFLARQDLRNLDKVLVVMDRPRDQIPEDIESLMRGKFPSLPLEFVYYNSRQRRACNLIAWAWVQCWVSWTLGIGAARTKYVLLHDFDAMLVRPSIIEERYQSIRERGHQYLGMCHYNGNGVVEADRLIGTFELMFDAEFIRNNFQAIDLFNHVTKFHGRRVDFDTFIYVQSQRGVGSTVVIREEDMVHPSQLISHFEDLRMGRHAVPPSNGLLLVPLFLYVGEEPEMLRELTVEMERMHGRTVSFFGKRLDVAGLEPDLLKWLAKQAFRLDTASVGEVREEVRRYFRAADRFIAHANGRSPVLEGS